MLPTPVVTLFMTAREIAETTAVAGKSAMGKSFRILQYLLILVVAGHWEGLSAGLPTVSAEAPRRNDLAIRSLEGGDEGQEQGN